MYIHTFVPMSSKINFPSFSTASNCSFLSVFYVLDVIDYETVDVWLPYQMNVFVVFSNIRTKATSGNNLILEASLILGNSKPMKYGMEENMTAKLYISNYHNQQQNK